MSASSHSFFRSQTEIEGFQQTQMAQPGQRIADFELVRFLRGGGMGQIWVARQITLDREVALKLIRPELVNQVSIAFFEREAKAVARLQHPGIVSVIDAGRTDEYHYMALELISDGFNFGDFLDRIREEPHLPEDYYRRITDLMLNLADALVATHRANVIHRDLKPRNILITEDDTAKITDFGLARITDEMGVSKTGDFAGTYEYMSPEQVTARRIGIDHRTDIFSLGVVLYEALTLRRPFEGDTQQQVATKILFEEPPPPRSVRSQIPWDLAVICGKALEKHPSHRYQSMEELREDLGRHLANQPILARPPGTWRRASKWIRRHPNLTKVLGTAVLSVAVIAVLLSKNIRDNAALRARNSLVEDQARALTLSNEAKDAARRDLQHEYDRSESLRLLLWAQQLLEEDPGLSLELANRSAEKAPSVAANNAILRALTHDCQTHVYPLPLEFNLQSLNLGDYEVRLDPSGRIIWTRVESRVWLVDSKNGAIHEPFPSQPPETLCAISAIEGVAAFAHQNGDLEVVDVGGTSIYRCQLELESPIALDVADGSHRVAVLTEHGRLEVLDYQLDKRVTTEVVQNTQWGGVSLSPDGAFVLLAKGMTHDVLGLTDLSMETRRGRSTFTPDGRLITVNGMAAEIRRRGRPKEVVPLSEATASLSTFDASNGLLIGITNDASLCMQPLGKQHRARLERIRSHGARPGFVACGMNDSADILAGLDLNGRLVTWDLRPRSDALSLSAESIHADAGFSGVATYSEDMRFILYSGATDGIFRCFDSETGSLYPSGIESSRWVRMAPDSQSYLIGFTDGVSFMTREGKLVPLHRHGLRYKYRRRGEGGKTSANELATGCFSPSGETVLVWAEDELILWRTADILKGGTWMPTRISFDDQAVVFATFDPSGLRVLVATSQGRVEVVEIESQGSSTQALELNAEDQVFQAAWGRDGGIVVLDLGTELCLWNLEKDRSERIPGHLGYHVGRSLSSRGELLVLMEVGGRVFDLHSGKSRTLTSHDLLVSASFSPDDEFVVAGTASGLVRIWTKSVAEYASFQAHDDAIMAVDFASDGTRFLTSAADGTVRAWPLDVRVSSSNRRRSLTDAERIRFGFSKPESDLSAEEIFVSVSSSVESIEASSGAYPNWLYDSESVSLDQIGSPVIKAVGRAGPHKARSWQLKRARHSAKVQMADLLTQRLVAAVTEMHGDQHDSIEAIARTAAEHSLLGIQQVEMFTHESNLWVQFKIRMDSVFRDRLSNTTANLLRQEAFEVMDFEEAMDDFFDDLISEAESSKH